MGWKSYIYEPFRAGLLLFRCHKHLVVCWFSSMATTLVLIADGVFNLDGAVWHAINDDDKEGTWTLSYSKVPVVYSNWAAGEPNNAGRVGENCAILSGSTGLWNDLDCIAWIGFVCEKQR